MGHESCKTADIYIRVAMKDSSKIEGPLDLMSNGNGCGKMIKDVENGYENLGLDIMPILTDIRNCIQIYRS